MIPDGLERPRAQEKRDIGIALRQMRAEVAPDRPGSDHHHLSHSALHSFTQLGVVL